MKKVTLIALFGLLATWFVLAVPEPRVGSSSSSSGGAAGENGNLTNATSWVSFTARGVFNLPPNTNTALVVHMTNYAIQCYTTNDSFTVTFQGTAADGATGEFAVWNTDDEDKTLTWPASWSTATGAGITSIPLISNSVTRVIWNRRSGSNYVSVIQKDAYTLGLLNPSVGQVLKVHCTSCGPGGGMILTNSADLNAGANTAYNDLGDSTGSGVVAMANNLQAYTTTKADGGVVNTETNSAADITADTFLNEWVYRDNADANAFFWKATHNAGGSIAAQLSSTLFQWNVASSNSAAHMNAGNLGVGGTVQAAGAIIPQSANDPDVTVEGSLTWDANGDVLRGYDGTRQVAVARVITAIHVTVVLPNDLADSERDAFWFWSNESGMSFTVTGWKGWSDTDDTTLNIEEIDADGQNNATVDAVEIATNGTGLFTGADTTITGATIENGHLLVLDFDDTDTPGQVKITIYGYFNADVN